MYEVDVEGSEAIDLDGSGELWELIEPGLFGPPVIAFAPEVQRRADELEGDAVVFGPCLVSEVGGQAGEGELAGEEVELGVWDVDLIEAGGWLDVSLLGSGPTLPGKIRRPSGY